MNCSNIVVSIIIVNYNTYSLVLDCIQSIINKTQNVSYEIIVVDNNSPDREIENLAAIFPRVNLILHNRNAGFGSGNNVGAKMAQGRYLFFLNSDTLLINDAVSILSKYLDNNVKVAVCGGNLYTNNLSPTTSYSYMKPSVFADIDYFLFNILTKLKYGNNLYFNHSEQPLKVKGSISGADYMIKKELYDELKGFDEDFFMYYEETELSFRVIKKGYEIHSVPGAKIIHLEGSSEQLKERTLDWTLDSKKKFYQKTNLLLNFYISNFLFFLTIIQRMIVFKIFRNDSKYIYWENIYNWAKKKLKKHFKI